VHERTIPPGHALNQDELARRFGVSRIPLREALRTLAGEGLVIMKPGLGAVVTELKPEEVEELYGLRLRLEPPLADGIIHHVRRRDVDDLAAIVTQMAAYTPGQFDEWSTANYRFHRRLYELSEQLHSVRLVVQVLNLVEPYVRMHAHVLGSRPRIEQSRLDAVEALKSGDGTALRGAIEFAILRGRDELMESMGQ
jgi:DNA-binding GntR family transcriptional regulator